MVEKMDGSVEFRYSVSKLVTQLVTGVALIIVGIWSMVVFVNYLEDLRTERILEYMAQGIVAISGDPGWAVLFQLGILFIILFGIIMAATYAFYLLSRDRVYLIITTEGLMHYKLSFHVIKPPTVKENYFEWYKISRVDLRKRHFFGESIALTRAEVKRSGKNKIYSIPNLCGETETEDIIQSIAKKMRG